jgi:hypothetical protein
LLGVGDEVFLVDDFGGSGLVVGVVVGFFEEVGVGVAGG